MARIIPTSLVQSIAGKTCQHDDTHFCYNRQTGQTYAVKKCNPYEGPATEKQTAHRTAFGHKSKLAAAWLAENKPTEEMPKGTEAYQVVREAYKGQHKIGNIFAFVRKVMNDEGVIVIGRMVSYAPEIADEPVAPTPGARQFTVTAVSADTTKGTVTGGGTFSEGSRITLTATPKGGYVFDRWSDGVTTATRTVVVSETKTLTATFKAATDTGGSGNDEDNYI